MRWVILCTVYQPRHLVIQGLLESSGIPFKLEYEAVAQIQGITMGPLGEVKFLVPEEYEAVARQLLESPVELGE
ncbi:MAG: hypothetical protein HPY50_11865 [Firmicutes bacterium]|nr:hypothetical protein [Bacillota bacterium]